MSETLRIARIRLNWMDRADIVEVLEKVGILAYDNEDVETLKEAVLDSVETGDISLDDLPEEPDPWDKPLNLPRRPYRFPRD